MCFAFFLLVYDKKTTVDKRILSFYFAGTLWHGNLVTRFVFLFPLFSTPTEKERERRNGNLNGRSPLRLRHFLFYFVLVNRNMFFSLFFFLNYLFIYFFKKNTNFATWNVPRRSTTIGDTHTLYEGALLSAFFVLCPRRFSFSLSPRSRRIDGNGVRLTSSAITARVLACSLIPPIYIDYHILSFSFSSKNRRVFIDPG